MWRHRSRPRPDWERLVTEQGLIYPTTDKPDGTTVPYWNESAWYELTMDEVELLETATEELWAMCVDAAGHMAATMTDERLGLPPGTLGLVRESIAREDPAIYARFDLAYGADGSVKMLEVNGDTATGLVETGVAQWRWLEDVMPDVDQWNSVHERLVNAWRRLLSYGALGDGLVHFLFDLGEEGSYDGGEMEMTVAYLVDCAVQAGVTAYAQPIAQVGWNPDARELRDAHDRPIRTAFKLYPWEQMLGEEFGRLLVDGAERQPVRWFEPPWKVLLSTKAILPVLWERNPGHRLLLPAYLDEPRDLVEWVAKPLHGREGDNIRVHLADGHETRMPGSYGAEGFAYQAYTELPVFEGNHVVLGSWIIDGQAAGMIVRESDGPVTDYFSRVVPHAISDTLPPDAAQVEAWILDRVPADPPRLPPR